jgi:hypothetical protein
MNSPTGKEGRAMNKLWILLTLLVLAIPAHASEKCPCPDEFVAKYECDNGQWLFAEGNNVVTLTGNCQEISWASGVEISCVMGKAGQDCTEYTGGYSGTITAGKHELSHLNFCQDGPTSVGVAHFSAHPRPSEGTSYAVFTWALVITLLWLVIARMKRQTR